MSASQFISTSATHCYYIDAQPLPHLLYSLDGSVAAIEWVIGKDINSLDINDPVAGFVFNNKGLMYNLTIEGSKITKIHK